MNSVLNKIHVAEKQYRHKLKKDKKDFRLNTKKQKMKQKSKVKKINGSYKKYNHQ